VESKKDFQLEADIQPEAIPSDIKNIQLRLDNVESKLETILESILFIRQNIPSVTIENAKENSEHLS